jgi:glycosyltransferase involved in cell wall biosynthesis
VTLPNLALPRIRQHVLVLRDVLVGFPPVRWALGATLFCRGLVFLAAGSEYRALADLCRVVRVSAAPPLRRVARMVVFRAIRRFVRDGHNTLVDSYRASRASADCAALYSLAGSGPHDLFRDLIVLKAAGPDERGVILLKYARTFDAVVAMFDLERLMARYTFVLEPCWAGYCDPSLLMLLATGHPVVVQCFTEEDYAFVTEVGEPFVPIRLGPADWVDRSVFVSAVSGPKDYDLVMVANWARHKRHAVLFRTLNEIRDRDLRVLLVGFPLGGRTADDIRREAGGIRNPRVRIEIVEGVPQRELAALLARCKVFVFLSRKEGDNKALVEAMFADVPAVVYRDSIGGATSRINAQTGLLSRDADLARTIVYMLDHHGEFAPRAWAEAHTGSAMATRVLDEALRRAVTRGGGRYDAGIVEKANAPNLTYVDPDCRARFEGDYQCILACRRQHLTPPAAARALSRGA